MSSIKPVGEVKLFAGILFRDKEYIDIIRDKLSSAFGPIDLTSPVWPWVHSSYYEKEMGTDLKRVFFFFERPIQPDQLPDIKIMTNEFEASFMATAKDGANSRGTKGDENQIKDSRGQGFKGSSELDLAASISAFYLHLTPRPLESLNPDFQRAFSGENLLRPVNIDPGYITLAKVVLASTKDYSHRVYIGKGIYAEVTLSYENKTFRPFSYTYPDYRSDEYIALFNMARG
ncbi:MAG: DUF4416 family protein [Nitrospirae bacterium]|nr:DUF4416 family protein [Nitrospirota bacterium]